jgi:hypothetical protein
VYERGKDIGLADCLSRLSLTEGPRIGERLDNELMVCYTETLAANKNAQIARATNDDTELQALKSLIREGWPEDRRDLPPGMSLYWDFREELSIYNGVVFRGNRICIPKIMRPAMLQNLHKSHMGMVKTKQFARDLMFWPGMAKQIEDVISKCPTCLEHRNQNAKLPLQVHEVPDRMWSKVGCDLFTYRLEQYLVMVDYYSGFIEVDKLPDTRADTVIEKIKANIARHGIMDILVSDGGPQFTSAEFAAFGRLYGFEHNISSPGHQQANGLAENAVKQIKNLLKKTEQENGDFYLNLLDLRNTPRDKNIGSPVQRLMSRRTKTTLPTAEKLLRPQVKETGLVKDTLQNYRARQKHYYDRNTRTPSDLKPGDAIRVRTPSGWKPAEYVQPHDMPRSHIIKAGDHAKLYRRNRQMLLKTKETPHKIQPVLRPLALGVRRQPANASSNRNISHNIPPPPPAPVNRPVASASRPIQNNPVPGFGVQRSRYGRNLKQPKWMEAYTK